jgi:diphthine synthase
VYSEDTICVGLARVGQEGQTIVAGTMAELRSVDFGDPLHCFIVAGDCHFLELDLLKEFAVNPATIEALKEKSRH